jgi:hypothetical protein
VGGDFLVEVCNGRDVLVNDRLVNERPKRFGGLQKIPGQSGGCAWRSRYSLQRRWLQKAGCFDKLARFACFSETNGCRLARHSVQGTSKQIKQRVADNKGYGGDYDDCYDKQ